MQRLALLGIGNLRLGPLTLASVASFYGERPLQVQLWDADAERLDLMDRLGWTLFRSAESLHRLTPVANWTDANDADAVILLVGRWCAFRVAPTETRETVVQSIATSLPLVTPVLQLVPGSRTPDALDLPGVPEALSDAERQARAFQILRWIQGDEPVTTLLQSGEESPIRSWLLQVERQRPPASR